MRLLTVRQDIHYVDVSKYSELPIPTAKNLFRYWLDKARWHKPSVIVLDNLDKLLSAEVEVRIFVDFIGVIRLISRMPARRFLPLQTPD